MGRSSEGGEEGRGCGGEQDEGAPEEAIVQAEPRCAQPGRPQVSFFPAVDGLQLGGGGEEGRGCGGEQAKGEPEEATVRAEPRCAQPGRPHVSFFPALDLHVAKIWAGSH
jgi:hypothetical protein